VSEARSAARTRADEREPEIPPEYTDATGSEIDGTSSSGHAVSEALSMGETQRVLPPARAESAAATESEIVGLLQFSRAEAARGRLEEALDLARQAHRIDRGRASLAHLQQLLIQARRFEPDDGAWLRQAAAGEPEDSASLHAAGLFEALHGDAWAARGLLGAALEQARRQSAPRKEIVRDLARLAAHDAHHRS